MALPAYASLEDRIWHHGARLLCYAVLLFLVLPIVIIVPISFTSGDMLAFPLPGFSLRWYQRILQGDAWIDAAKNSLFIGVSTTILAMALGTSAAMGLWRMRFRWKPLLIGLIISPLLIPIVITAVAMYFLLAADRAVGNLCRPDPGPHRAGRAVRGRHRAGDAGRLRHQPRPRRQQPGRAAADRVPQGDAADHLPGHRFRRACSPSRRRSMRSW